MHITSNNKQDNTETITITLEQKDYKPRIEESLKKYSKSVNIPGFRPGKASVSHLRHVYGNTVLFEEINKIVDEALNSYIQKNNLDVVGEPILVNENAFKDLSIESSQNINCEFEIGFSPDMYVDIKNKEFIKYNIKPSNQDIDKEIELLQKAFAERQEVEKSDLTSMLSVEVEKIYVDENNKGDITSRLVDIKSINTETIRNIFLDLYVGHTFNISISNLDAQDLQELLNNTLKIQNENIQQEVINNLKIKVNKIWKEEIPAVNSELFSKVFPNDTPGNMDEFRKSLEKGIESRYNEYSEINLAGQIVSYIEKELEKKNLPEIFLKKWLKRANNQLSEDNIDEGFKKFLDNLRWALFEKKVKKNENIEVSKEEITQAAILHISEVSRSHNYNMTQEQLKTHTKELLQDKNSLQSLYQNTLSAKVYKYMRDIVTVNLKDLNFDQFDELSKKMPIADLAYKIAKEAFVRGYLVN
ncbi:MAG: trigger factor [Solitalea-like symbiont of Tyrophagus putrescentiae]